MLTQPNDLLALTRTRFLNLAAFAVGRKLLPSCDGVRVANRRQHERLAWNGLENSSNSMIYRKKMHGFLVHRMLCRTRTVSGPKNSGAHGTLANCSNTLIMHKGIEYGNIRRNLRSTIGEAL